MRLTCVGEGQGDVEALPALCSRILHALGLNHRWFVDKQVIRHPRSNMVDMRAAGPGRPCRTEAIGRVLQQAEARRPDAILIVCDADDDCPGAWASSVPTRSPRDLPVAAVMANREYEAWLLWNLADEIRAAADIRDPERVRDAKGAMRRAVPGYQPTIHQLQHTRQIDVARVRERSRSFDKLVRTLMALCA